MTTLRVGRGAFAFGAAVMLLAGCGGVAVSPAAGTTAQFHETRSWMLPEAQREDLLYADTGDGSVHNLYVLSYPKGKLVGTISEPDAAYQQGLCSDAKGDVFVTTLSKQLLRRGHLRTRPRPYKTNSNP